MWWTVLVFFGGACVGVAGGLLVAGLCVVAGREKEREAQLQKELNRMVRGEREESQAEREWTGSTRLGLGRW